MSLRRFAALVVRPEAAVLAVLLTACVAPTHSVVGTAKTPPDTTRQSFVSDPDELTLRPFAAGLCIYGPDCVMRALLVADDALAASAEYATPDTELPEASDLSVELAAWLNVDRATNLARVAAAPDAAPQPVTINLERRARGERNVPPGELHLYTLNTRESFTIRVFDNEGRMRADAIDMASRALRDQRANRIRSIDPRLLQMLYRVGQHFDSVVQVVSGYRVRGENASQGSRHGSAQACDIRVPGRSIEEIAAYVETTFANLGCGVYPTSDFVHIDSRRRTYYWSDRSGPGQRSRTRTRAIRRRADRDADITLHSPHVPQSWLFISPDEAPPPTEE